VPIVVIPTEKWPGADRREPRRTAPNWVIRRPLVDWLRTEAELARERYGRARILDVGCGTKAYFPIFAGAASEYVGVDVQENPYADVHGAIEALPLPDSSFDVVLCTQVLEHVPDPARAVSELYRVTAPGGRVLASTHGVMYYHPDPFDLWRWTHEGLERLFGANGHWESLAVRPGAGTSACVGMILGMYLHLLAKRAHVAPAVRPAISLVNAVASAAPEGLPYLARALDARSARLRERVVYVLAGSTAGAQLLMDAVREGRLPAQTLAEPTLRERLVAGKPESVRTAVAALAQADSATEVARERRIQAFASRLVARAGSAEQGARVFTANCSACHAVRGQGGQVGPQLDGVGHRAPAELLAKVLAPNRTVAPAFRYETVILKNGDVFTGLYRREQGVSVAFVDREGKEISVPKSQIVERRSSAHTLMPNNFMDVISEADLQHLVAYLGTLR